MIEQVLLIIFSLVMSVFVFYGIKQILKEGVKDELVFPLGICDVSMFEEILSEQKNENEVEG